MFHNLKNKANILKGGKSILLGKGSSAYLRQNQNMREVGVLIFL